ncbi:GCN5 family N-acetyltransferase [Roseibium aquae]|uniref:GCN5 family N-acetyltransferase n=1 Tax=Roseibium aquae TaxID=1323746 RepID=A0A916TPN9_9HYPH|nr:GNAT family N-acetyltransferase [Roseibium aquae]GGB58512.1 GCN5 family N-acetyltransferase [Roseibium aquae]
MPDFIIRRIEPADRAGWNRLWQDYLVFYKADLSGETTGDLFRRLVGQGGHEGLVAVRGDELIGFAHYVFQPVTFDTALNCYLEDLYVAPDARGSGAAHQLIEAVYRAADDEPEASGKVYWLTETHNARARKLYDRVGVLTDMIRYQRV